MSNNLNPFFESIAIYHGRIPFFSEHYERIKNLSNAIECELGFDKNEFDLSIRNNEFDITKNYRIRIFLKKEVQTLHIEKIQIEEVAPELIFPKEAVDLCIYPHQHKQKSNISNYKQFQQWLYLDSIKYAEEKGYFQSIILNEDGEIAETSTSNIYLIKDSQIYTPFLTSGCIQGVFRKLLLQSHSIKEKLIYPEDLANFDEVFLSNAVRGIISVKRIEQIEYKTTISNQLQLEWSQKIKSL